MANPVEVLGKGDVVDVTLSLDTNAYADNDVLAAPQEVKNFYRADGACAFIHSIVLQDESDQAQDVELIFMNATGSIGNENAAYAPADAVLNTIVGTVLIEAADYSDAANGQTVTKTNVGLKVKAAAATTSIWVAAVCRSGTPTYSAAGLKLKIGVMWD